MSRCFYFHWFKVIRDCWFCWYWLILSVHEEGLFQKPVTCTLRLYSTFDIYVFINHHCLNFLCIIKPGDTMVILATKYFENLNIIFFYCSNKDVYTTCIYKSLVVIMYNSLNLWIIFPQHGNLTIYLNYITSFLSRVTMI